MTRTKNNIAHTMYGEDFEDLSPWQKAAVTKKYNVQGVASAPVARTRGGDFVTAEIGRVGNGMTKHVLNAGSTVGDLLRVSPLKGYDEKKEKLLDGSGISVNLADAVKNGETYFIAPEIRSA